MSNYVVSARKYRPKKFSEVVGQQHVTNTLRNALKNDQLAQALLFTGPRGIGKTTCARILAKVINCQNKDENFDGCQDGENEIMENVDSFSVFELDAASNNGVDDIRNLTEQVRFAPPEGKKKVYIIDEVHMLSTQAFNAFLKTLEEPPPYAIFILATTEKHKILPTILSRCQIYDFKRISTESIIEHLKEIATKESVEVDENALHLIASKADGALRDALSIFDRLVSFGDGKITYENTLSSLNILDYDYFFDFIDFFLAEDMAATLNSYNKIQQLGFDGSVFLSGLAEHIRNILVSIDKSTVQLLDVGKELEKRYLSQAAITPKQFLLNALDVVNRADMSFKAVKNKRLHVEMALIRLCYLNAIAPVASGENGEVKKKPELKIEPPKIEEKTLPIPAVVQAEKEASAIDTKTATAPTQKKEIEPTAEIAELTEIEASLEPQMVEEKPKYKIHNTASNAVIIPSLADLETVIEQEKIKKQQEAKPSEINTENVQLDPQKVTELLTNYANSLKEQSKQILGTLIGNIDFTINGHLVEVRVDSKMKNQQIKGEKENLVKYLKKHLQEPAVDLNITIMESTHQVASQKTPYSPKERLQQMIEQNPAVRELIEKLDLKFEY